MKNYYAVLGIPPNATEDEVKAAYRAAAWRLHPDQGGDAAAFDAAAHAYRVLSDRDERIAHDRALALLFNACAVCGGMGRVRRNLSFTDTAMLPCAACHQEGYHARA